MGRLDLPDKPRDEDEPNRPRLELAVISHNKPWLVREQIRLLRKHLDEDFGYTVVDSSSNETAANDIRFICGVNDVGYLRSPSHEHSESLNFARDHLLGTGAPFIGFLDHDVFPAKRTRLVPRIEDAGFAGLGQRHAPTDRLYLWPGFCFFSVAWLAGRPLDFMGIRGDEKANDGDTGSGMWPLFTDADWALMWRMPHGYEVIRKPDDYGLQSYGYERLGDFVHLSNASGWMAVPNFAEREALLQAMVADL